MFSPGLPSVDNLNFCFLSLGIKSLNKPNSIFIDDSFRERKDVFINCKIPSLTPEEVIYLL